MNQHQKNTPTYGVTNDEIMDFLKEQMVTKEELRTEFGQFRSEIREEMHSEFGKFRSEIRDEVRLEFGKFRSEMTDYMDRRLLDLKTDLATMNKLEHRRVDAVLDLMLKKELITQKEASAIATMQLFPAS